jgi:O-glycosyl hydrolase
MSRTSAFLAATVAACLFSADASSTTNGPILITAESPHQEITDWGYDIKQRGKAAALDTSLASELFVDAGMTVLRIPILAGAFWGEEAGHQGSGQINESAYTEIIDAVHRVQAANPDVIVFASLKTHSDHTRAFPAWVKYPSGGPRPREYAKLLFDFLSYMKANQVAVSVLGVDNERASPAAMTPAKHNAVVTSLTSLCSAAGIVVPLLIAPEPYGPSSASSSWLDELGKRGWGGSADLAGTHYYSHEREARGSAYVNRLARFTRAAETRHLWNSEFHWSDVGDDYDDALFGLISAFDNFDNGFQGMAWWNFRPESSGSVKAEMQTALVKSTIKAYPVDVDDQDGYFLNDTKINTRAFKQGRDIVLWILNDTATSFAGKTIKIPGEAIGPSAAPTFTQWTLLQPSGSVVRESGSVDVGTSDGLFPITLPKKSITYVRVPNVYPPQFDDDAARYSGAGWSVTSHRAHYRGTSHESSTWGNRVTYTFTGTGVRWVGSVATHHGKAAVYIDGVLKTTVDGYAPFKTQKVRYSISGLAPGQHTIRIEVLHTKNPRSRGYVVNVDGFYTL